MRIGKWGVAALVLGAALCTWTNSAHAQLTDRSGHYQTAYEAAQIASDSLVAYDSYSEEGEYLEGEECYSGDCGGCNECEGGGGSTDSFPRGFKGLLGRPGQFFFGATYIYARSNFSEALAYVDSQPASLNCCNPVRMLGC